VRLKQKASREMIKGRKDGELGHNIYSRNKFKDKDRH
jgi:hypothetical protein